MELKLCRTHILAGHTVLLRDFALLFNCKLQQAIPLILSPEFYRAIPFNSKERVK